MKLITPLRKESNSTHRSVNGFTLIETLIAMAILTGGIILMANSWGGNLLRMRKSKIVFEISTLIERKMVDIDNQYRDNVSSIPESDEGDFETDDKNLKKYRWKLESKQMVVPNLSDLLGTEENDQISVAMVKTLTKTLEKSIKEVKLTIIGDFGKRELKQSIVTYFVDFDQRLEVQGLPSFSGAPTK